MEVSSLELAMSGKRRRTLRHRVTKPGNDGLADGRHRQQHQSIAPTCKSQSSNHRGSQRLLSDLGDLSDEEIFYTCSLASPRVTLTSIFFLPRKMVTRTTSLARCLFII